MTTRALKTGVYGTFLATLLCGSAAAESKRALVIVKDDAQAAQAIALSETFLGLGFAVTRLQAPDDQTLDTALESLAQHPGPAAVYYAGDDMGLADFAANAGVAPRFFFTDTCVADRDETPANVFAVNGCDADFAEVVQNWLNVPGLNTDQWASGNGVSVTSTLTEPFVFRPTTSDVRLTSEDYAMLETLSPEARAQMIRLWRAAGIAVDMAGVDQITAQAPVVVARDTVQVVAPVRSALVTETVRPVAPTLVAGGTPSDTGVTVIAGAANAALDLPTAGENGLPTPSILVGFAADDLPEAPEVPDEPVAGAVFGGDDVAAREALREQDADLFSRLITTGAFDPQNTDLTRALQVELARINCYTAGIDGAWGPGSQRALAAFYEASGQVQPGSAPDLENFRAVIAASGIRCPDPAPTPVPQPVAQSRPAVQSAPAQSQRAAPTPAPAPAPAAPQSTPRRSITQTGGSGIFR